MLNILSKIYNGNFTPCELLNTSSDKYKEEVQKASDLREELMKTLNSEQLQLLDEYVSYSLLASGTLLEEHFLDGLLIGMEVSEELNDYNKNIINRTKNYGNQNT